MERLTERSKFALPVLVRGRALGPAYFNKERDYKDYADALERLAQYEDAEGSGLLVRLPCKVGDTVYWVPDLSGDIILTDTISAICLYRGNRLRVVLPKVDVEPIYPNAHLFLTREEAEKALEAKR